MFSSDCTPLTHESASGDESRRIHERRVLVLKDEHPSARPWGLAISGGGIRSATFALGVLQALAGIRLKRDEPAPGEKDRPRRSLLHYFDYLSTVSGGGYTGAFFCSLFVPNRLAPSAATEPSALGRIIAQFKYTGAGTAKGEPADGAKEEAAPDASQRAAGSAYEVLAYDPPTRYRSSDPGPAHPGRYPTAWLRDNGRYLTPTGGGDLFYALGIAVRNWVSLHVMIGTVLLFMFAIVAATRSGMAELWPWYANREREALERSLDLLAPMYGALWLSPLLWVPVLLIPFIVAAGIAFWICHPMPRQRLDDRLWAGTWAALLAAAAGAAFYWISWQMTPGSAPAIGLKVLGGTTLAGLLVHLGTFWGKSIAAQRASTTRFLSFLLLAALATLFLAVADTLGQTLYRLLLDPERKAWPYLSPAAVLGAIVWIVRHFAAKPALPKIPLSWLAGAAALAMLLLVALAWQFLVHWIQWRGGMPDPEAVAGAGRHDWILLLALVAFLLAFAMGKFANFINLSSLQAFYSARLTRAYLGASNGERFASAETRARSVAEPHDKDEITHEAYYGRDVLAPLHIINVTLNQTSDPAEQLVQRDRKGKPLAILPHGFSVDGEHFAFREETLFLSEIQRPLTIGRWIGTSGAAFSTGLGRATTLGTSLALGLANVRLGTWWDSGIPRSAKKVRRKSYELAFTSQTYLAYELFARFHGTRRRWQYLSDGGHFENTGLYELLRKDRDVQLIVVCDDGCDPRYELNDLANLARLARIDFRAEVEVDPAIANHMRLGAVFGTPEQFAQRRKYPDKCALLLTVRYVDGGVPGPVERVIVLLKPRVVTGVSVDVAEYAATHPSFPQEPTADQFFDEAQWESYRKLGRTIVDRVFGDDLGPELWRYLQRYGINTERQIVSAASAAARADRPIPRPQGE